MAIGELKTRRSFLESGATGLAAIVLSSQMPEVRGQQKPQEGPYYWLKFHIINPVDHELDPFGFGDITPSVYRVAGHKNEVQEKYLELRRMGVIPDVAPADKHLADLIAHLKADKNYLQDTFEFSNHMLKIDPPGKVSGLYFSVNRGVVTKKDIPTIVLILDGNLDQDSSFNLSGIEEYEVRLETGNESRFSRGGGKNYETWFFNSKRNKNSYRAVKMEPNADMHNDNYRFPEFNSVLDAIDITNMRGQLFNALSNQQIVLKKEHTGNLLYHGKLSH